MKHFITKISLLIVAFFMAIAPLPVRADTAELVDVYRLYNPNSGEHFYTVSAGERDALRKAGWWYEGVGWKAAKEGYDVKRLYNPYVGEHFYTLNSEEQKALEAAGSTTHHLGRSLEVGACENRPG